MMGRWVGLVPGTRDKYQSSGMESNQDAHTTNNGQPRALWIEEGNALALKKEYVS